MLTPPNFLSGHNGGGASGRAGGRARSKGGEAEASPEETPGKEKESEEPADPVELANQLVQLLQEGGGGESSPKATPPPAYVDDLKLDAEQSGSDAATAASKCWYAVWLLSEGSDKDIPEQSTANRETRGVAPADGFDTYEDAEKLLVDSANAGYKPAQLIQSIIANGAIPAEAAGLRNDGDLFYYLGKAYLSGRNILAGETNLQNFNPKSWQPAMTEEMTDQNRALAVQIFQLADKLGSPAARLQLALMYGSGFGEPRDPEQAFDAAKAAAAMSDMVAPDPTDSPALATFRQDDRKAAVSGAEQQLGIYYMTGFGTGVDESAAQTCISKSQAEAPDSSN